MSRKTGKPSYAAKSATVSRLGPGRVWRTISALATAAAVGVFIGVQVAAPNAAESSIADLRAAEARRDVAQIGELTARARETAKAVKPLLDGLAPNAAPAAESQVAQWKQVIAREQQWYAVTVSGTTATNVARGSLRNAVEQLAVAVDTYAAARAAPADAHSPLLALAARQRELALLNWSVAATQLDQINIDAGNGHQHVYLDTTGVGGAMTGDNLPEGTGK